MPERAESTDESTDESTEESVIEEQEPTGSPGARRKAMVILEVLGGVRTPTDAAEELGIPTPRYYQWEERGVEGLVAALEPKKRGPKRDPEKEIERMKEELEALRKECARYEALLRSAQRAIGLRAEQKETSTRKKSSKRSRKPTVRALTAIGKIERKEEAEQE